MNSIMGEGKMKMEMLQTRKKQHVTFSRRKSGLFKKASELATDFNAEVGIVIFSPGNKPYSFGKPNLDVISERFKNEDEEPDSAGEGAEGPILELEKLRNHLNSITEEIEAEKKRGKESQKWLESAGEKRFEKSFEELTHEELKENEAMLEKMHGKIQCNINRVQASTSLVFLSKDTGSGGKKRGH